MPTACSRRTRSWDARWWSCALTARGGRRCHFTCSHCALEIAGRHGVRVEALPCAPQRQRQRAQYATRRRLSTGDFVAARECQLRPRLDPAAHSARARPAGRAPAAAAATRPHSNRLLILILIRSQRTAAAQHRRAGVRAPAVGVRSGRLAARVSETRVHSRVRPTAASFPLYTRPTGFACAGGVW